MKHWYDEKTPRHTRLFELIRQENQADTTVARLRGLTIRQITRDEAEQLQQSAMRSLQTRH